MRTGISRESERFDVLVALSEIHLLPSDKAFGPHCLIKFFDMSAICTRHLCRL
jgi:hypothetical protein